MTHGWIAVLAIVAALESAAPPPPAGRLCIGERRAVLTDGRCAKTIGAKIAVTPADGERLFLWTRDDASTAFIGVTSATRANSSRQRSRDS